MKKMVFQFKNSINIFYLDLSLIEKSVKTNTFNIPNPQIAQSRRRSSWSVMKHLIKGLNGLMSPQVLFIKNEACSL